MQLSRALAVFERASNTPYWIVAFSGGADSVLLLELALEAAGKHAKTHIMAFYLHHYPTPVETARQLAFDTIFARAKNILPGRFSICMQNSNVAQIAGRLGRSWEHTASLLRRRHLERLSHKLGGAQVFTGHQLSDYRETLQLRAERRVPQPAWPSLSEHDESTDFLRPLIYFTRTQVRSLVNDRSLVWYEDPSNSDTSIARNRIRAEQEDPAGDNGADVRCEEAAGPKPLRICRRELRMPVDDWHQLTPLHRARVIYKAWRRLSVVRNFTRNEFSRAQRLPFRLPPFFVHTESLAEGEFVIFRRGLGALPSTPAPGGKTVRGDAVTRSLKLRMPYGRKSVTKIFSERRLSPRQRRLTWVKLNEAGTEAIRVFFPEGASL